MKTGRQPQFWLWVARPENYFDENGQDSPELNVSKRTAPFRWWTCHRDTLKGDLVLMYRTSPNKDIAYLVQARSDAFPLVGEPAARDQGWRSGCKFRVLHKFGSPITLDDLADDPALRNWPPYRAHFRNMVYSMTPLYWKALVRLAEQKDPTFHAGELP